MLHNEARKLILEGYDKAVCLFTWRKQSCRFCTTFQAQEHELDGTLRYTTFSGGTTVERFKR